MAFTELPTYCQECRKAATFSACGAFIAPPKGWIICVRPRPDGATYHAAFYCSRACVEAELQHRSPPEGKKPLPH